MSSQTYGFAHSGMDPRDFTPDFDQCHPEEIAAWRTALAQAEAGKPWDDPHPPIEYNGEIIRRYSGSTWGIGIKTWHDDTEGGTP